MLFLTEQDVRSLLPMPAAIRRMREAFEALAQATAQNQPRRRLILPTGAVLHSMAGAFGPYFGTKFYSTHPRHGAHFLFALYEAETAKPLALFEANYLGQIRTGAASGLATDLMARPGAETLALIGSGFQARSQLEAIRAVRPIRSARVWSRTPEKRQAFAQEFGVEAPATAEQAVRGADIIVTATFAKDPVIEADWVSPGAHINAMGSNHAQRRELSSELVQQADLLVVDSFEQARLEAGDLLLSLQPEDWNRVVELQYVVVHHEPRTTNHGLTIFKSLGLGLQDVAAAALVYEEARKRQVGMSIPVLYS